MNVFTRLLQTFNRKMSENMEEFEAFYLTHDLQRCLGIRHTWWSVSSNTRVLFNQSFCSSEVWFSSSAREDKTTSRPQVEGIEHLFHQNSWSFVTFILNHVTQNVDTSSFQLQSSLYSRWEQHLRGTGEEKKGEGEVEEGEVEEEWRNRKIWRQSSKRWGRRWQRGRRGQFPSADTNSTESRIKCKACNKSTSGAQLFIWLNICI